jgi:hypothetical protein
MMVWELWQLLANDYDTPGTWDKSAIRYLSKKGG